jgi:hypothetical protein
MNKVLPAAAVLGLASLAACTVPETMRGSVYQFNGDSVTIRGAFSQDGTPARPTAAMVEQAREVCPNATYLSANPTPDDVYTFLYLFRC